VSISTQRPATFEQYLGEYASDGFSLEAFLHNVVVLYFKGAVVDWFHEAELSIELIMKSCQGYLRRFNALYDLMDF